MAEIPAVRVPVTVDVTTVGGSDFVQIGERVFNRRHIVGLTNIGSRKTMVHTTKVDYPVDVRLAFAAKALGVGNFDEVPS